MTPKPYLLVVALTLGVLGCKPRGPADVSTADQGFYTYSADDNLTWTYGDVPWPSKNQRLVFMGANGKQLVLEMGDKMIVTGDLKYDEAARLLLNSIGLLYCKGAGE